MPLRRTSFQPDCLILQISMLSKYLRHEKIILILHMSWKIILRNKLVESEIFGGGELHEIVSTTY